MNLVALMGRLTADPELKATPSGVSVYSGTIAVDGAFGKDGNKKTDFIRITAWRNTAEFICNYFHKGSMIAIAGGIEVNNYTTPKGEKKTITQVRVDRAFFCGSKQEADNEVYKKANLDFEPIGEDDGDDEFPW